jgi:hypothetical protein
MLPDDRLIACVCCQLCSNWLAEDSCYALCGQDVGRGQSCDWCMSDVELDGCPEMERMDLLWIWAPGVLTTKVAELSSLSGHGMGGP